MKRRKAVQNKGGTAENIPSFSEKDGFLFTTKINFGKRTFGEAELSEETVRKEK